MLIRRFHGYLIPVSLTTKLKMAEAVGGSQYAKSRLSRMRNVRANAAGMLRRAPSFLPESCNGAGGVGSCAASAGGGLSRAGSTKLQRSNSSSSTFYVQLPKHSSGRPLFVSRHRQMEPESESETSGCESGTSRRHRQTGFSFKLNLIGFDGVCVCVEVGAANQFLSPHTNFYF